MEIVEFSCLLGMCFSVWKQVMFSRVFSTMSRLLQRHHLIASFSFCNYYWINGNALTWLLICMSTTWSYAIMFWCIVCCTIVDNFTCPEPDLMHKCSNNRCIYKRWMCDGEDDCRNGEDEIPEMCNRTSTRIFYSHTCSYLKGMCCDFHWLTDARIVGGFI